MLEIPTSFNPRPRPAAVAAAGGNPTEIFTKLRFFNESNDMADVEAYGSEVGMTYQPIGVLPGVGPHSGTETMGQFPGFPPSGDGPHHFMVILHHNGEPLGPFYFAHMANPISDLEVTLFVNASAQTVHIEIGGRDGGGAPIQPVVYAG